MKKKTLTMRNVILKRIFCLFVPPIYSLLCKGCRNEDCRYALILLAMEAVSFLLDLLGGIHWGYLLASFLLSVLILETTIDAYFIKKSRIKSESLQLIAVEIVFSVLQLLISFCCLIKTLSGVKTNYSSSVFPLAYAITSVFFTFKSEKHVSHSSSDTPPDLDNLELNEVTVDPAGTPVDDVDPLDQSLVSVATSDATIDPSDPTLASSVPTSDAEVDPLHPTLIPVPTSDAEVDPLDPTLVSMPTSDAKLDPLDPTLVANTLRQRKKQSGYKKIVLEVELGHDKAKKRAMTTLRGNPGVYSIQVDTNGKILTLIGDVNPVRVVSKLRKQCHAEIISVGPAEEEKMKGEQPKRDAQKKADDKREV